MLCSCASEIILPDDKLSSKLVVLGELEAHEPISFRIGKSIPLTHQSALKFQDLDEADIIVSNSTGAFYNFHAEVDSLTEHLHTLSARYNSVVTPDLFYTVKVKHSSYDSVYCITYIPEDFNTQVIDTSTIRYAEALLWRVRVQFSDEVNAENYYTIEVFKRAGYQNLANPLDTIWSDVRYRVPLFTDDPNTDNIIASHPSYTNKRILLPDKVFNGSSYFTNVYIDKQALEKSSTYEQLVIEVKSVSKEYYEYLKVYDQYDPKLGLNGNTKTIDLKGNIVNGFGILGGVNKYEFTYAL